jgi:hypothetical protein
MKKYFSFLFILFFIFSCKNEEKQNVISASPSAKVRKTPHQNGEELYSLTKGEKVEIMGISSHKDKIEIEGKEVEENWYLIKIGNRIDKQGWVYGGCIEFSYNYLKPSFKNAETKDLYGKAVDIAPCFNFFNGEGQPECETDCNFGTIHFLNNNDFFCLNTCKNDETEYYLGYYAISDNHLTLTFNNLLHSKVKVKDSAKEKFINKEKATLEFEVHNFNNRPVFLPLNNKAEYFLGNPYFSSDLYQDFLEIIEDLKLENKKSK